MKLGEIYNRVKWVVLGVLAVLLLIVVCQNLEAVRVRFLLSTASISMALLICIVAMIGFALGYITSTLRRVRAKKAKAAREQAAEG